MAFSAPFPHVFIVGEYSVGEIPKSVDELDIIKLSTAIRNKPNWEQKIRDPAIVTKWREEAANMTPRIQLSEKMNYVLKELDWICATKDRTTGIEISTVDNTFHSDTLIPESLRQELISGVQALELVPDAQKDWHPGSNEQVLDLVHPSLYPLLIGKSPVLKEPHVPKPEADAEQGTSHSQSQSQGSQSGLQFYDHLLYFAKKKDVLTAGKAKDLALDYVQDLPDYSKSKEYQWLPSDVQIDEEGNAKFSSYINNLHPQKYPELYSCLEKILTKFVPMFEHVLASLRNEPENRIEVDSDWYTPEEDPDEEEEEEEDQFARRTFKPRSIPDFEIPLVLAPLKLNGRKLQVIVKLANIHLTPDKPYYPGGVWHLEGMANERIVSSGIYYYSNENITESHLYFRQAIQEPEYEQQDNRGVRVMYGLQDEEALNQEIGAILTKQGRCIGFPNTLQHKVAAFSLMDETRPGHRKILVFFLVDPTIEILSTSRVPPQQKPWLLKELEREPSLPDLIVRKIIGKMEWPLGLKEAKEIREKLMEERKYFVDSSNEELFQRPFSLCEH